MVLGWCDEQNDPLIQLDTTKGSNSHIEEDSKQYCHGNIAEYKAQKHGCACNRTQKYLHISANKGLLHNGKSENRVEKLSSVVRINGQNRAISGSNRSQVVRALLIRFTPGLGDLDCLVTHQ